MSNEVQIVRGCVNTLNTVCVSGKENMEKLVGVMNALNDLKNLLAMKEKQQEQQQEKQQEKGAESDG